MVVIKNSWWLELFYHKITQNDKEMNNKDKKNHQRGSTKRSNHIQFKIIRKGDRETRIKKVIKKKKKKDVKQFPKMEDMDLWFGKGPTEYPVYWIKTTHPTAHSHTIPEQQINRDHLKIFHRAEAGHRGLGLRMNGIRFSTINFKHWKRSVKKDLKGLKEKFST